MVGLTGSTVFIKTPAGCDFEASWFIPKPSVLVLNEFHEKVHSWMAYQGVLCLSMYPKDVISSFRESISKPSASSRGENIPSGGLVSLIGLRDVLGGFLGKRPVEVREAKEWIWLQREHMFGRPVRQDHCKRAGAGGGLPGPSKRTPDRFSDSFSRPLNLSTPHDTPLTPSYLGGRRILNDSKKFPAGP